METPEFFDGGYYNTQFTPEKRHHSDTKVQAADHFIIDDLLNFPNDDPVSPDPFLESLPGGSTESSAVTVVNSCNSTFSGGDPPLSADMGGRNFAAESQFSSDLCVPYDDLAELEWLSNFTEESFSTEDLQKLQIISGMKARPDESSDTQENPTRNSPIFSSEVSVPGKARSKRSRAAPGNWTSRLLAVSTPVILGPASPESNPNPVVPNPMGSSGKKTVRKKEVIDNASGGEGRRCLHCATDKTPQWRTGPMGPKTLCNACGVRYKSGRLVPEYRPASSPTFVLTKHSNSHRKVMELRRQKEVQRTQQQTHQQFIHQNMMFDVSNGEDYLIHQHLGPDFRQLI